MIKTAQFSGAMISGAAQGGKKRHSTMRKTDAMRHAERQNGKILDELWRVCGASAKGVTVRKKGGNVSRTPSLLSPDSTFPGSGRASPNILLEVSDDGAERSSRFLRLNVGGSPFLLLIDSILRADQGGLLAKFIQLEHYARLKVADGYLDGEETYYFQRSPIAFEPIFQYYCTGVIHCPPDLCYFSLASELEFWRIPTHFIASCCSDEMSFSPKHEETEEEKSDKNPSFEKLCCGRFRRRMWQFLERPGSSLQAKAFELSSTLFVAISVLGLSFDVTKIFELQDVEKIPTGLEETVQHPNGTITTREKFIDMRVEHPAFILTERVCIAFFTLEYALRFFAAPYKLRFALKPLNVVDLLAIIPFYLELVLTLCGVDDRKLRDLRWAFLVVRILRVLRVIRIIKLGRFSSGLQTFGMTLKRSQKQLQMMTIVLLTGVVFFSTMIYFLEKDDPGTPFTSIPAAYWWCVVTMTTVGYGDIVPATTLGKIIASAAIMSGVLVLALPITIIVDNFIKVAQEESQAEQLRLDGLEYDDTEGGDYVRSPVPLRRRDNSIDRRTSAACVSALVV